MKEINKQLTEQARLIAVATNPQCHFGMEEQLPECDQKAIIASLKGDMQELMLVKEIYEGE